MRDLGVLRAFRIARTTLQLLQLAARAGAIVGLRAIVKSIEEEQRRHRDRIGQFIQAGTHHSNESLPPSLFMDLFPEKRAHGLVVFTGKLFRANVERPTGPAIPVEQRGRILTLP